MIFIAYSFIYLFIYLLRNEGNSMSGCLNIIKFYIKQTLDGGTMLYVKEKRMFWYEKQKYWDWYIYVGGWHRNGTNV